jgi:hypothetical protein
VTKSAFSNLRAAWLIAAVAFAACGDDASQEQNPVQGAGSGAPAAGSGSPAATAGSGVAGTGSSTVAGTGAAGSGRGQATAGSTGSPGTAGRGNAGSGVVGAAGSGTAGARAGSAGVGASAAGTGAPAGTGGLAGRGAGAGGSSAGRGAAGSGGTPAAGSGGGGGGSSAGGATFTQVYGILMAGCSCHISGAQGGLSLSSKMTAYTNLVGANSTACSGQKRVVASNPDSSVLVHAVERTMLSTCRVPAMPANGAPKLSQANLDTIRGWVMAGAMND